MAVLGYVGKGLVRRTGPYSEGMAMGQLLSNGAGDRGKALCTVFDLF